MSVLTHPTYGEPVPAGSYVPIQNLSAPMEEGKVYQFNYHADNLLYEDAYKNVAWPVDLINGIIAEVEKTSGVKVKYIAISETAHGVDIVVQAKYYGSQCPACAKKFSATAIPIIPIVLLSSAIVGVIGLYLAGEIFENVGETITENWMLQLAVIGGVGIGMVFALGYLVNAIGGQHYVTPGIGQAVGRIGLRESYL